MDIIDNSNKEVEDLICDILLYKSTKEYELNYNDFNKIIFDNLKSKLNENNIKYNKIIFKSINNINDIIISYNRLFNENIIVSNKNELIDELYKSTLNEIPKFYNYFITKQFQVLENAKEDVDVVFISGNEHITVSLFDHQNRIIYFFDPSFNANESSKYIESLIFVYPKYYYYRIIPVINYNLQELETNTIICDQKIPEDMFCRLWTYYFVLMICILGMSLETFTKQIFSDDNKKNFLCLYELIIYLYKK